MTEYGISDAERTAGALTASTLTSAAAALRHDGFVILHGAVDTAVGDKLGRRMLQDIPAIMALPEPPYNLAWANVQHDPAPDRDYLLPEIMFNPYVLAVTRAVLGEGVHNGFYSGNTNLPRSRAQPAHVDTARLWRDRRRGRPACELVVNIAPLGMDDENGATEIWPGSHLDTTVSRHDPSIWVPEDILEARRCERPPISAYLPVGSVLIRDIRLWHRGVPNPSDDPRSMIAMIHRAAFLAPHAVDFPVGTADVFDRSDLHWTVRFRADPIDCRGRNRPYDYDGSGPAGFAAGNIP